MLYKSINTPEALTLTSGGPPLSATLIPERGVRKQEKERKKNARNIYKETCVLEKIGEGKKIYVITGKKREKYEMAIVSLSGSTSTRLSSK